jgi:predicted anti-sigma-YlaC factor YlaD
MDKLCIEKAEPDEQRLSLTDKCENQSYFVTLTHLVLDKEADAVEMKFFLDHIIQCSICRTTYEMEKTWRIDFKGKIKASKVPEDLINRIRNKIKAQV